MMGLSSTARRRLARRGPIAAAAAAVTLSGGASAANAASFVVTDPTDAALSNPAGTTCVSTDSGGCTLRAAVQAADNTGGASTIAVSPGTYKLTIASTGADDPATGDLDVKGGVALTITAADAATTIIDANHIDRAFAVQQNASLAISGVTIEHGVAGHSGPSTNSTDPFNGGAVYNDGNLSIANSALLDNYAWDNGGAIVTGADAVSTSITNSTATGNTADDPAAVAYVSTGNLTFTNDTLTDNAANDEGGVLDDFAPTGSVTISGSTFSDTAGDDDGGALDLGNGGETTISGSDFEDNNTGGDSGGAIYATGSGSVSITGSAFTDNSSDGSDGGAVWADGPSALTITKSTFSGNSAGGANGGAVYVGSTPLSVSGSTFADNQANNGGALEVASSSPATINSVTTSTLTRNQAASSNGGAIDDEDGSLSVTRSTLSANTASSRGGGLYYDSDAGLTLTNDTFDSNAAATGGGGLYLDTTAPTGTIALLNDTLSRNTAYQGGGINHPEDANTIEDTIVAGNFGGTDDESGEDCFASSGAVQSDAAGTADKGGNIDSDGTCFSATVSHDHVGVAPDLGALASNGGAEQTDALLAGSPAIGAAVPGSCSATDERGVARPAACDSGAYQTATAGLAITGSAPATSPAGTPLTYTFHVTATGSGAASNVILADVLPTGSSYYSASASQGSCSGTTSITCSLGTIDSASTSGTGTAGSVTVTIVVIPSHAGTFRDTASAGLSSASTVSATATTKVTPAPSLPVAVTGTASQIKSSSAKLSGIADPEGASTTYYFQYGTSKRYGKSTKHKTLKAGTSLKSVVASLKGLKAGKQYHFRLVAVNANGTFDGKDAKFRTKK